MSFSFGLGHLYLTELKALIKLNSSYGMNISCACNLNIEIEVLDFAWDNF